ncbi:MAG: L,D-transpeptidase family protein [Syntrophales bacterium]|nr:L,D-transpeptidase family protein [Syntrophales bacterium]
MILTGIALLFSLQAFAVDKIDSGTSVQAIIQARVAPTPADPSAVKDQKQDMGTLVRDFYARRDYRPAWNSVHASALVKTIRECASEGLTPDDYPLSQMETFSQFDAQNGEGNEIITNKRYAEFDILLTETFMTFGRHLSQGRINPEASFFQWVPHRRSVDLVQTLQDGLAQNDIEKALKGLAPRHPSYAQMRHELATLRHIAESGGWPAFNGTSRLKRGDHSKAVALLKERMIRTGDLKPEHMGDFSRFDAHLEAAIRIFQWRHGLIQNGMVDKETLAALNVPVERRIRQMEINMERWRWLPDDFGPRYIMTIIPDLWLYVVDDNKTVLSMKTVIGTPKQPSPVFSDEMTYLELNPTWGLPNSIIANEIIPKIKKDPEYLTKKRIRIFRNWSEKAKEIAPKDINWAKINPEKFPYRMIQDSGVNPLGRIKFIFPNDFDVYLHDTTQKGLFQRQRRLYSHGCIRIEKPYALGEWILRDDPSWSRLRLLAEIKKGKRLQIGLPRTVPVHVMYLTAWVDGNGLLQFRNDYYGYDKIFEDTLRNIARHDSKRL